MDNQVNSICAGQGLLLSKSMFGDCFCPSS